MNVVGLHAVFNLLLFRLLVIRENRQIHGREADFDAAVRKNRQISGWEGIFNEGASSLFMSYWLPLDSED